MQVFQRPIGTRGHIHEALATLRPRKSLAGPIYPIVHGLPNKRFAWPQCCKEFVNMAPCSVKIVSEKNATLAISNIASSLEA
jgi:hypothetical protein